MQPDHSEILENLSHGVFRIGLTDGRVWYANRRFRELFPAILPGNRFFDCFRKNDDWLEFQRKARFHKTPEAFAFMHDRSDSGHFWACYSIHNRGQDIIEGVVEEMNNHSGNEPLQAALFRITEKSNSLDQLEELLRELHEIVASLLYAKNFYVALIDPERSLVDFSYWADEFDPPPGPRPFNRGLTEYVLDSGQPLLVDDAEILQMAEAGLIDLIGTPSNSWLGVPLHHGQTVFGVLVVQSYTEAIHYGERERDVLIYVSHHIANAIWRKQAEDAKKEIDRRFRETLDFLPDIVLEIDESGHILYVNQAVTEITQFSTGELQNPEDLRKLIHPDDYSRIGQRLLDARAHGHSIAEELRVGRRDGTSFPAIFRANSILFAGKTPGFRCTITDITFIKQVEESLQETEKKYHELFQESLDTVYICDERGGFQDINPAGVRLFGYGAKEEMRYLELVRDLFVHVADRTRFRREMDRHGFVRDFEVQLKSRDGKLVDASITSNAETSDNKAIIRYHGIIRDETERRALEQQFLQAQKMESIGLLAGGIAHDFNNILVGILGYASFIKTRMGTDHEFFRYVDIIEKSASRAAELTSQLLAFGRGGKYNLKPVNLNKLILESLKIIIPSFDRSIQIETDLEESLGTVEVDATQIEQALINLCVNARDAMPNGGQMQIRSQVEYVSKNESRRNLSKQPGWFAVVTVRDTGGGIDPENLQRIFEPFFTTKEKGRGTGLGLSMVYGVIKNHGGFILVDSERGNGSSFKIFLPMSDKTEYPDEEPGCEVNGGREGILVIDDEESIRQFCFDVLRGYGYQVYLAANGLEGLKLYRDQPDSIHLVILDMIMPKMGGKETLINLRRINPHLPVLLSTGFGENDEVRSMMQEGVSGFIQKPYQVPALVSRIREILDKTKVPPQ